MEISTIGLDLAKNVFQVHGISATGEVVIRKALRRSQMLPFFEKLPPCLVGAEACGTLHYWARELTRLGHEVRLMPAAYVKPYVKRGKNDVADAEAICEAVTRQTMRFRSLAQRRLRHHADGGLRKKGNHMAGCCAAMRRPARLCEQVTDSQ